MSDITSNLVHYWAFDDGSGSTATDSAGSNNGTLVGSPTWGTGIISGALSFNGSSQYVNAGSMTFGTSAVTLAVWVKATAFQASFPFISSVMGAENSDVNIGTCMIRLGDASLANNKPQFLLTIAGSTQSLNGSVGLTTGTWAHVAATFDGTTMKIYVNGTLDTSATHSGALKSTAQFWLANNVQSPTRYLNGALDDARIYSRALADVDIAALYALGTGGSSNTIAVPKGSITMSAKVPTIVTTANKKIVVPLGVIAMSTKVPTIVATANKTVAVPKASITMTPHAPSVVVGNNKVVSVPKASITYTAKTPTIKVTANKKILVPAAHETLTAKVPTIKATANIVIQVPKGAIHMTPRAPTISNGVQPTSVPDGGVANVNWGKSVVNINYDANLNESSSVSQDKTDSVVRVGRK